MNLEWQDPRASKFITNVGLITTRDGFGDNIMAAEWTHQISYYPGLIAVCINKHNKVTNGNILDSKSFIVHLASLDQNVVAHIAGNHYALEIDKIGWLKSIGYKFKKAKKINGLVLQGCAFVAECKLKEKIEVGGSHNIWIGEIVYIYPESKKESLIYYKRKFWQANKQIKKPKKKMLNRIENLKRRFKKY